MDEDFKSLQKSLINLLTESEKSDYEGLYKNWGKSGSQEERRAQLLETQKYNRYNNIDTFRGVLELDDIDEDNSEIFEPFNKVLYRPKAYVAGFHRANSIYSNVLMLSEWMIEKPIDFEENWFMVPCPKGVRVLAVAKNGVTKFYTKYGNFKFERYTGLPGGSPFHCYWKKKCVLDCFYYEPLNTLYVLDVLAWNNVSMTIGNPADFRSFWLKAHLEEHPDTKTVNDKNQVIIKALPKIPCTTHYLSLMLGAYPQFQDNRPPLDGLLFYHKEADYVAGETPLVGWLYPYMIPEVLGTEISMHPGYLAETPADYIDQADFIQKFEARAKKTVAMAMETAEQNNTNEKLQG